MRIFINGSTQEFIARIYCDLGKNILSIGVASFFFKDMPLPFRFTFGILGIGLLFYSVFIMAKKGDK
jgi:hypothetical protein